MCVRNVVMFSSRDIEHGFLGSRHESKLHVVDLYVYKEAGSQYYLMKIGTTEIFTSCTCMHSSSPQGKVILILPATRESHLARNCVASRLSRSENR